MVDPYLAEMAAAPRHMISGAWLAETGPAVGVWQTCESLERRSGAPAVGSVCRSHRSVRLDPMPGEL